MGTEFTFVAEASGDLVPVQWIKSVGNRSYTVNGDTIVLTVPGEDVTLYPIFKDKNASGQTDPRVKEPTAKKDLKYNGREKVLIDRGSVVGGTMYYALTLSGSPEPGEDAYSSTVIPAATDAGSYDVWYKVIGDPDHNNVAPDHLTVEIAKAEYDGIVSVHKTVTAGEETDGVIVLPSLPEGASYASAGTISQNCALVTAFTVSGNDLIYSTSAQAKGESAVISIGVSGAKNYEDYAVEVTLTTEGEDWPEPQIIEPEAYTSLKADGSEKQLLKEGRVLGGTLYYVLGNDSETPPGDGWSKNVPVAGKAGTYYVWYMVLGNTGYKDTEPKCIAVVISEGDNGEQGGSGNEEGGGEQGGSGNEEGGGKQTDPENSLKPGEAEVTEGDVITEPKAVSSLAPATVRVDGKEIAFTLSQNYVDAVTYRGRTIDPEKDLNMRVDKTPIVSQVILLSGSSISADDLVTVGYVQKNAKNANSKSAKKSTVYAKFKVSKAAKKALSSEDLKKLKKLVKAANKALKKTKCTYTINPLSVTSCRLSVSAKLTEDGKLKVKNGKLKGIKKVYAAIDGAVVPVKLTKKEYEILSPDENAKTVFLKGKKNYTGTAFVTVE